jgi:hypothetical protein
MMHEHDRDQSAGHSEHHDDRHARRGRLTEITGLADLLPDWILPQEGKQHVRNARKELLLAARSVLDRAIERQEAGPAPRRTVSRVEID